MEAKAVRIDAQLWGGRPGSARQALQTAMPTSNRYLFGLT
jgi:hypothetical protein